MLAPLLYAPIRSNNITYFSSSSEFYRVFSLIIQAINSVRLSSIAECYPLLPIIIVRTVSQFRGCHQPSGVANDRRLGSLLKYQLANRGKKDL
jgi:hypothetical protein